MNIQTIKVSAKEWFDKVNGNSYFSATILINYGLKSCTIIKLPMQYGYGDQYKHEVFDVLQEKNLIPIQKGFYSQYYSDNNITVTHTKKENCKKKDLN